MSATGADLAEVRATFDTDGVVLVRNVFDTTRIAELRTDFDLIVQRLRTSGEEINARWDSAAVYEQAEATSIVHTHQVQNHSATWLDALRDPMLLDVVEALIGPDIVLHHTKLFEKPPRTGAPFPLHQDWRYFPTDNDSMIAAIIYVSDATEEMGCVRAVPGSHRLGRRPSTSGRMIWDDPDDYRAFLDEFAGHHAASYEAHAGDVLFFSYFTVHGSEVNRSDVPRKTVLAQLYSGADRLDPSSDHPVSGLVLRGHNHRATRSSVVE